MTLSPKRLALTGIVAVLALLAAVGLGRLLDGEAGRDAGGVVTSAGGSDAQSLRTGDCIDQDLSGLNEGERVSRIRVVPCDEPHSGEVYFSFTLPYPTYPSEQGVRDVADGKCAQQFDFFVGRSVEASVFGYAHLSPVQENYQQQRRVTCLLTGEDLVGTAQDAAR